VIVGSGRFGRRPLLMVDGWLIQSVVLEPVESRRSASD